LGKKYMTIEHKDGCQDASVQIHTLCITSFFSERERLVHLRRDHSHYCVTVEGILQMKEWNDSESKGAF
jgi:hypothetical protein